jgi:ABC-2 type transport system permease protein
MIRVQLRILCASAVVGLADLRAIYTWRTWAFAWLSRILCQVAFFALIGRLLNSARETRFLLIGNAVYMVTMIAMFACVSAAWERETGTLPLLIASPSSAFAVFAGRSINWMIDGTACAAISLFALGPLFRVPAPWPQALLAVPIIACIALSTTCFALVLAGIVLRHLNQRSLVTNIGYFTLMLLSGVEVPVASLPPGIRVISECLPLTHGLQAIRQLYSGAPLNQVAAQACLEILTGTCWFGIAWLAFIHFARQGRRTGSIEYGS